MEFQPNNIYRYVMKEGMTGWDIESLQIAFNSTKSFAYLEEDGIFGPHTAAVARQLQTSLKITVDGIVGPQTQSTLCARECEKVSDVPKGLLKGICFGESGGIIPTTSGKYPNGSRDYGPFQDNMVNPTQIHLKEAFMLGLQAKNVGIDLLNAYKGFLGKPGAKTVEEAWRLAVLNYNWPAAAYKIANGEGNTWIYNSESKQYHMSDPAPWVEQYGIPGVKTGWQWAEYYINSKIVFVISW